jgi:hypothetical protein
MYMSSGTHQIAACIRVLALQCIRSYVEEVVEKRTLYNKHPVRSRGEQIDYAYTLTPLRVLSSSYR